MCNEKTFSGLCDQLIMGQGLVLVVDDEPIMRKIAVNLLKACGYEVLSACDGEEALAIFRQHHPCIDLVILDLHMPNKSGNETFLEMKKIKPQVHALLVTGAEKDHHVDDLLQQGVWGYIEKPYEFMDFTQAVYNAIQEISSNHH